MSLVKLELLLYVCKIISFLLDVLSLECSIEIFMALLISVRLGALGD